MVGADGPTLKKTDPTAAAAPVISGADSVSTEQTNLFFILGI